MTPSGLAFALAVACGLESCSSTLVPPGARCVVRDSRTWIAVDSIDYYDLLFVISDAPSMAEEQAQLATELPSLVNALVTGEVNGVKVYDPVEDLHVGIVSATFADGGALHQVPVPGGDGCANEYPDFLGFHGDYYGRDQDDPVAFIKNVQCLAELGAASTRPNQALEAALEALSSPAPGFLRNDPYMGKSLIGIVVVADTDDCSAASGTSIAGSPPSTTASCAAQSDALQSIEYYVDQLHALRSGQPSNVLFSVIGGIPPNLTQLGTPPILLGDETERDRFYQQILDDPSMQPSPDPNAPQRLLPACVRGAATAEPARRLVSLAQRFVENGLPISICDEHWTEAITLLAPPLQKQIGTVCPRQPILRGADGRIPCKVYWDLPAPGEGPPSTPTECSALPFLTRAAGESSRGGQRCEVAQAAIASDDQLAAADQAAGFYYDDFSERAHTACIGAVKARIAFTDHAKPPIGVQPTLDCVALDIEPIADGATPAPSDCNVAGVTRLGIDAGSVGRRCMPASIPDQGFDDVDVWIESGAHDCGTGVCMAFHLQGDPRPSCAARSAAAGPETDPSSPPLMCSAPEQIADHLYCSCRCRAADPSFPSCTCPRGFSCHEVLTQGGLALEGGYCVKDGTYPDPGP